MSITLEMREGLPVYAPAEGEGLMGLVILHGSEGPAAGWGHRFAAILASHGMVVIPFAYGEGDIWRAGRIAGVDLRQVVAAGEVLSRHERVRGVGLFGWSFGGGMALITSALQGEAGVFKAVASHAGTDFVTGAWEPERRLVEGANRETLTAGVPAFVWPGEEEVLRPGAPLPLERISVPVFLSVGDADTVLSPQLTLNVAQRLRDLGREVDLLVAEGQGHGYTFDREPELWARLLGFFGRYL